MTQNQYRCEECGATFDSMEAREQHNRTAHSKYTCEECGQVFGSEAELESHNRMAHPEKQGTMKR
jgi:DNA-directed RNA polymerase subunit RPC12/RpoP